VRCVAESSLEHDPETRKPVFGKDHAQRNISPHPNGFVATLHHESLTRKLNMFNYCLAQLGRTERGMGSERSRRATGAPSIAAAAAHRVRVGHVLAPSNA